MPAPEHIWHLRWTEHGRPGGARDVERRYRKAEKVARQVLAVLSAPDDVVELRELAVTDGWDRDRLSWRRLEPREFVVAHLSETADDANIEDDEGLLAAYARIEQAWAEHQARVAGGPVSPPIGTGIGEASPSPAAPPATASSTKGT